MTEHKLQVSLINWLEQNKDKLTNRDIFPFAVPNAGLRSNRVGAMMKAEGLRSGVADLCFMLDGGRVAWMEMKTTTGRQSDYQRGFEYRCKQLGHPYALCRSLDEAIGVLRGWGVLKPDARAA